MRIVIRLWYGFYHDVLRNRFFWFLTLFLATGILLIAHEIINNIPGGAA
jgi:hypothetical protein